MRLILIDQVDNNKLNLENLKKEGLKAAPQGPRKLNEYSLLSYINNNFNDLYQNDFFPEAVYEPKEIYEGLKKKIIVNKYERSSIARTKCLEYHGTICSVCSLNF